MCILHKDIDKLIKRFSCLLVNSKLSKFLDTEYVKAMPSDEVLGTDVYQFSFLRLLTFKNLNKE